MTAPHPFRLALLCSALALPALAADPQAQPTTVKADRPTLDVVFVLDTTGSMGGLIEGAKQKIWSIASRMASGQPTPRIRVGLVAYRDRGDAYETKRFDLSENLDDVYKNLRGFEAGGGGDGPEHVGKGLGEAVKLMSWSQEPRTAKMIFLVGDAPAHDDYQDEWNTKTWAKRAIEKGIVVNTIRCGNDGSTEVLFQAIASAADGTYVSIQQSGGVVATATPFDDEMKKTSAAIADRTLVAGTKEGRAAGLAELEDLKAMSASTSSDRAAYKTKAAPAAPATEMVRAKGAITLNADPTMVNSMKAEELPAAVAALPAAEREGYVRQQNAEQAKLNTKLQELSRKRDAYLKEQAEKAPDSFDEQVFNSVTTSAAKVGVKY